MLNGFRECWKGSLKIGFTLFVVDPKKLIKHKKKKNLRTKLNNTHSNKINVQFWKLKIKRGILAESTEIQNHARYLM